MSSAPFISVLVSTFNRPQLLSDALLSVSHQTFADFECVVVNDGEEPVELPPDNRFRLIDKREGMGYAAAMNLGIREARGRYLTILDDDDAYTPRRLDLGVRGASGAPLSICWRANYDTGLAGRNRTLEGWVNDVIVDRPPPLLGQATIERSRMLPFEERLRHAADVEWWIRATRVMPITTIPEVGFLFRRHDQRLSTNMEVRYSQRLLLYELHSDYFKRHRRAAARFHKRTGLFAYESGHHIEARRQLWSAAKASPAPRTLYHLARSLRPKAKELET
jgi:glycosyltransferase involved in cell wall biosynthesis